MPISPHQIYGTPAAERIQFPGLFHVASRDDSSAASRLAEADSRICREGPSFSALSGLGTKIHGLLQTQERQLVSEDGESRSLMAS
jgi:hypothetical protein